MHKLAKNLLPLFVTSVSLCSIGMLAESNCPSIEIAGAGGGSASSMTDMLEGALQSGDLIWALLLILLAGFLTALSPCVYPLIPITLSIMGAKKYNSHWHGFLISGTYVLGMVTLYTALGTLFASLGMVFGAVFQNPWVIGGIGILFGVLALEMLGAYELSLPQSLSNRLNQVGGNGYRGAFLMGLVAGLIAAPCTGPIAAFILTLIAQDGDVAAGSLFMAIYAFGIGLPFLVLGTFSASISKLPKSGGWMNTVKSAFGLAMLVAAAYYLQLAIKPLSQFMALFSANGFALGLGLAILGLALGALHFSFDEKHNLRHYKKGFGIFFATLGLTLVVNAFGIEQTDQPEKLKLHWLVMNHEKDPEKTFDSILEKRKPCQRVFVDFYADWCVACKELEHKTFINPQVAEILKDFLLIMVDATEDSQGLQALQKRFGVVGLPHGAFFSSAGKTLKKPKITGFIEPEAMLNMLTQLP